MRTLLFKTHNTTCSRNINSLNLISLMSTSKIVVAEAHHDETITHVQLNHKNSIPNVQNFSWPDILKGSLPIIDIEALHGPHRSDIIKQLGHACQHYGLFMVKNQGISEEVLDDIIGAGREFFHLPDEERMKFSRPDPRGSTTISLLTAFEDKSRNVFVSRESLKFHTLPIEYQVNLWPSNPPSFRKSAAEYSKAIERAEITLIEAIFEGLGMERVSIDKILNKHGHHVTVNYYPRCEESKLAATYGLRPHTDPCNITMLLTDDIPGLQILEDDQWITVNPIPNTLIVLVGDLLQAISNDQYKTRIHRVVVNPETERLSISSFCYPSTETMIGPLKNLIDKNHPAVYKDFPYQDFFDQIRKATNSWSFADQRLQSFKSSVA